MAIIFEFNGKQYVSATTYIKLEQENKKLSEKNGQLKSDLAFKNTMLDNVKAEYESSVNVIRKLNKRIKELEQCNLNLQTWIDNKEKVNKSLRVN